MALYKLAGAVLGKPVSRPLWNILTVNGISRMRPTRRSQRGGTMSRQTMRLTPRDDINKQRHIDTISSNSQYDISRDIAMAIVNTNICGTVRENSKFGRDLPSGLRFVQWNACSVYPKLDELRLIMSDSKREADVLGITESWLNATYSHSSVAIDGYNLERRDRSTGRGGGVAVYLHDSVPYNRRHDLEKDQLEDLWVEIKFPCSTGILLGTVYRQWYR